MKIINFKTFITESRFSSISPDEEKQAELLIQNFRRKYNTPKKIQKIKQLARNRRVLIGKIKVIDQKTKKTKIAPVYITRRTQSASYRNYDPLIKKTDVITLNYIKALNGTDKDDIVVHLKHELRHATQQYKTVTDEYYKHLRKKPGFEDDIYYYTDPSELDAQESEVFVRLKDYVRQLQRISINNTQFYKIAMDKFKNQLNIFLTKPWEDKAVIKNLPKPLWQKHEMLTALNRVPKLWKRFKLKIKTFLDELDKY